VPPTHRQRHNLGRSARMENAQPWGRTRPVVRMA
jgi:hypothetical protein